MNANSRNSLGGGSSAGSPERRRVVRLYLFGTCCALWSLLVVFRLWDLQVRQGSRFLAQAVRQHEEKLTIQARRGRIFDRDGADLAVSSPVESIAVFPSKVQNPAAAAALIADVLEIPPAEVEQKLAKPGFQWIKRLVEPGQARRLRELRIGGVHFEAESKRYYPKGPLASHVLGYVGLDHVGQGGLELRFEDVLTGAPGERRVWFDAAAERYQSALVTAPRPGSDLYLTIDESIQSAAEERLVEAIERTGSRAGVVVVMDPSNGDVLAMANWPTFNPNLRPRDQADLARRLNFAVNRLYEPGSTFKIVTVAAALEAGLTDPNEIIDCENGRIYIGRIRIRDHKRFGLLSVGDVIAKSSNVGAIKLAQRLGPARLREFATRFGFGETTGIELPGEIPGLLRPLKLWRDVSLASIAIGQEIGVTPLQMARAFCVIANGGYLVQPRVVDAIGGPEGRRPLERPAPRRVLSASTAAKMRAMLERTTLSGTARLAALPGYRTAGKTGTAQLIDEETRAYSKDRYIASFGGFAPLNDPSIAMVIVLDSPRGEAYHGGQVAAPVFPQIAAPALRLRDVPPTAPIAPARFEPPAPALDDLVEGAEIVAGAAEDEPTLPLDQDGAVLVSSRAPIVSTAEQEAREDGEIVKDASAPPAAPAHLRVTSVETPNFRGSTLREAVVRAAALGLRLDARGEGVALSQRPEPATPIPGGSTVTVRFGRLIAGARP